MSKVYVSWNAIEKFVQNVVNQYKDKDITGVYGLPRGGLVLAVMVSHRLGVPMLMSPCEGCIIIDDICDTAGSLTAGCEILKKHGASEIYCAITHGVFSRDAVTKIQNSPIRKMIITDTIPLSEENKAKTDKIKVLSVADMIATAIDSILNHMPVSRVYEMYRD